MLANLSTRPAGENAWPGVFAGLVGDWLGLSLLKFGNPVILDRLVEAPDGFWEYVFNPWPVAWGYWMLTGLVIAGATISRLGHEARRNSTQVNP